MHHPSLAVNHSSHCQCLSRSISYQERAAVVLVDVVVTRVAGFDHGLLVLVEAAEAGRDPEEDEEEDEEEEESEGGSVHHSRHRADGHSHAVVARRLGHLVHSGQQ